MAWIELHDTLPDHDKVLSVAESLKLDKDMVVGKLVRLWVWALNNREDGTFKARDIETIAEVMRFKGKPQKLVDALVAARLFDRIEDLFTGEVCYVIHDWDERVGMLLAKRETVRAQTRARVQKHRKKRMDGLYCAYCGNAATGYDHIIPVSKGGTDDANNLVPCCPDCNREKNNRPLADFLNTSCRPQRELVESNEQLMRHVSFDNGRYTMQSVTRYTMQNVTQCNAATVPKPYQDDDEDDEDDITAYTRAGDLDEDTAAYFEADGIVKAAFKTSFGRNATPAEVEALSRIAVVNDKGQLIAEAIRRAGVYGAKSVTTYVSRIIQEWAYQEIDTMEELAQYDYLQDCITGKVVGGIDQEEAFKRLQIFREEKRNLRSGGF